MSHNPTKRFSNRVADYIKYRPSYPSAIINLLQNTCQLSPTAVVADIGSGTGLLTKLFLDNGNPVYGVEPNAEMRAAGETFLESYANFTSIAATAEATTLPDDSVDMVTAGQAFHWFDHAKALAEFRHILKPEGWLALIWNERQIDTPFLEVYETLLQTYSMDYQQVDHRNVSDEKLKALLGDGLQIAKFPNQQRFDFEGLKGRLMSSSYCPLPGDPNHDPLMIGLQEAFAEYKVKEQVAFEYLTHVYYCQI